MYILLVKIAVFLFAAVGILFFGYKKGKKDQNLDNLERVLNEAKQIKIDEHKRAADPISVVDERLRKHTRD